ncbi:MAG: hypothetical protein QQN58_07545 [Nitrosopumilus sp.]
MKLDISDIETSAYQNFLDYIRNEQTRIKYSSDLKKFLDLVPDKIYKDNDIESTDKTEAFVTLVRADVKVSKLAGCWLASVKLSNYNFRDLN